MDLFFSTPQWALGENLSFTVKLDIMMQLNPELLRRCSGWFKVQNLAPWPGPGASVAAADLSLKLNDNFNDSGAEDLGRVQVSLTTLTRVGHLKCFG